MRVILRLTIASARIAIVMVCGLYPYVPRKTVPFVAIGCLLTNQKKALTHHGLEAKSHGKVEH